MRRSYERRAGNVGVKIIKKATRWTRCSAMALQQVTVTKSGDYILKTSQTKVEITAGPSATVFVKPAIYTHNRQA